MRHLHRSGPKKGRRHRDCGRTQISQSLASPHQCPSHGRVQQWTSAGKSPKKSHIVSLFGPPSVIPTCRDSIRKPLHHRQIGLETWPSRASKSAPGTWNTKVLNRFLLIVHYLESHGQYAVVSGSSKKTCAGIAYPTLPCQASSSRTQERLLGQWRTHLRSFD